MTLVSCYCVLLLFNNKLYLKLCTNSSLFFQHGSKHDSRIPFLSLSSLKNKETKQNKTQQQQKAPPPPKRNKKQIVVKGMEKSQCCW